MRPQLVITGGVAVERLEGFVTAHWGDETGQWTPSEARTFGLAVIEAADAADFDAALCRWGASNGMSVDDQARILAAVRKGRGLPPTRSGRAGT